MTCGETQAQWAPTLGASVWEGSLGGDTLVLSLTTVGNLAAALVGAVPLAGIWSVDSSELVASVATEGISYNINLLGTCEAEVVVSASGNATDALFHAHAVSVERVI